MNLFDVYPLFDIEITNGKGCYTYDASGNEYLDLYGGHAVISVGHTHPYYTQKLIEQAQKLIFYSNSVVNSLQTELARKLGEQCGYDDYSLFLINSGAEANENALKLASFQTGKKKVISFKKAFHGRTSAAVKVTDNPKIVAPINNSIPVVYLELNDIDSVEREIKGGDVCAVIIEGIQGVGGIRIPTPAFLQQLRRLCTEHGVILILDEIQSGYGRSGRFFAHQYADIKADIVTMAKGMGNGFPIGGLLISPDFKPEYGMLGTTFGGNHFACTAAIAVLDIMKREKLVENAAVVGSYLKECLQTMPQIMEVRGEGLMIGLEFAEPIKDLRRKLLFEQKVFTGVSGTNTIRLLPPLVLTRSQVDLFVERLNRALKA